MGKSQQPLKASEIMADKPGRAIESAGPGSRSAVEYRTDPVELRERRFLEEVAAELEAKHREGAFNRLVIAAAPDALGELRQALAAGVRASVLAELPKDLTHVPTPALARHLDGILLV
jgi:protein required for attachment to host cells